MKNIQLAREYQIGYNRACTMQSRFLLRQGKKIRNPYSLKEKLKRELFDYGVCDAIEDYIRLKEF